MSDFPGALFYPNTLFFEGIQNQLGEKLINPNTFIFEGNQSQVGQSLINATITGVQKHYFLTASCSIGPTQLYWIDNQISISKAPSCGGTITGLSVLGTFSS